jgi:hypothetical protein
MITYEIKIPITADIREIFFNRNTNKLSYKNNLGIIKTLEDDSIVGPQGPQGPIGATGLQGVAGPVGPAGLNWQGTWVSGTSYVVDDAVGFGGASWFCINPTSGTTDPDLDPTNWALLASQGSPGVNGGTGPQGIAGPNSITTGVTLANIGAINQVFFNNGANVQGNTRFIYDEAIGYFNHSGRTVDHTNSAIGFAALSANVLGVNNTVIGYAAGGSISTANDNTAIGYGALGNTTIGSTNVGIGAYSLLQNTAGNRNVGIGRSTLSSNQGNDNVAIGDEALSFLTGTSNVAIGKNSGDSSTVGTGNTLIGAGTQNADFDYSVAIGYLATATANNQFVVGSAFANAGAVTTAAQAQTKYWNVIINGVAQKILLG